MKKLLVTLLLISPFSFADWGDVYYCQMTTFSRTTPEGKRTDYRLEKFQFKLDKTKNAMVFGKGGYFADYEKKIVWMGVDAWEAVSDTARLFFSSGRLVFASVTMEVNSMTANCDKF